MQSPAMIRLSFLIAGLLFDQSCFAVKGIQSGLPQAERSIPDKLAGVLCERQATSVDFANHGMLDAQVKVVSIKPKNSAAKVTLIKARERAYKLAIEDEQLGYAAGICPDGSGWAMVLPAPSGFTLENNYLRIPGGVSAACLPGSLKTMFAPEHRGRALALTISKSLIVDMPRLRGYTAVTCVLKEYPKSGPRELALFPILGTNADPKDVGRALSLNQTPGLADWINSKRRSENLPSLELDIAMTEAAQSLISRKDIHHDLSVLQSVRSTLQKKGFSFLGEDRVRGKDFDELIGLLWMSPTHRDLILTPTGDVMGVALHKDENGVFAVILAGKKNSGSVAKVLERE